MKTWTVVLLAAAEVFAAQTGASARAGSEPVDAVSEAVAEEIAWVRGELRGAEYVRRNRQDVEERIARLEREVEKLERVVPPEPELEELLDVERIASEGG